MSEYTINIQEDIYSKISTVVDILNTRLNTNFTFDEIINHALLSLVHKRPYVSIFSTLSGKMKYTLDDAIKLADLTEEEDEALEMLIAMYYRDQSIRSLANEISSDISFGLPSVHTDNLVDELYFKLKDELDYRKKSESYRNGYKKLIIKSAVISLVRKDNSY